MEISPRATLGLHASTHFLEERAQPHAGGSEHLPQPVFHLSPPLKALSQGNSDSQILDLSNRFYTLIPHDFGMKKPPLLNNTDSVQVSTGVQEGPSSLLGCGAAQSVAPCDSLFTSQPLRAGVSSGRATSMSSLCSGVPTHMGGHRTTGRTDGFSCLAPPHQSWGEEPWEWESLSYSSPWSPSLPHQGACG